MSAEKNETRDKLNILAVEDEENLLNLYTTILTSEGHRVVAAMNGAEAIEKAEKETFDLVILDLKLPDMDGMEVLSRVKGKISDISVIIITACPSLESALEAIKAGVYDYVIKPFNPPQLRFMVKKAVERANLVKENKRLLEELEKAREKIMELEGKQ